MDSAEFHEAVYHVARQIPTGKVTSYGHIAKLLGMPNYSRHVGQALKFLGPQAGAAGTVPWQRVLGSAGTISSRGPGTSGAERQRQALEAEGVVVTVGRTGDLRVDLTIYGWFPEVGTIDLPQSQVGGELDAHDQEHSNGEEID